MATPEELAPFDGRIEFIPVAFPLEYPPESVHSPFAVKILLLPPEDIATHENTDPREVKKTRKGLKRTGWNRRPVAIAGTVDDSLYDQLPSGISIPKHPFPKHTFGLLDGHHRREASVGRGFPLIPAQVFPLHSPFLVIGTWREGEIVLTPDEVRAIFLSGKNAPSKATKFQVLGNDGQLRRIRDIQPMIRMTSVQKIGGLTRE